MSSELDAEVAVKIMGYVRESSPRELERLNRYVTPEEIMESVTWYRRPDYGWAESLPCYSSNVAAAMEVVEKMRERRYLVGIGNSKTGWEVVFIAKGVKPERFDSESLPEAICKAALSAVTQ